MVRLLAVDWMIMGLKGFFPSMGLFLFVPIGLSKIIRPYLATIQVALFATTRPQYCEEDHKLILKEQC